MQRDIPATCLIDLSRYSDSDWCIQNWFNEPVKTISLTTSFTSVWCIQNGLQQTWDCVTSRLGTHYGKRFYSICPHTCTTFPAGSRSLSSMGQSLFKFKIDSLLIFKDHWSRYWEWNFRGESEIPVSNNLLGNTVDRRLLPSETAVHDRRLLECKIWYDSCLMSSDTLQSKYLPSYHSLYCFTQSGYDIQIFEKARSMDKTRAEIEQKGKRKLVANVQWVSSLLSLFISTLNNRVRHLIPFENQEIQKNFLLVKFQQKRGVVSKR